MNENVREIVIHRNSLPAAYHASLVKLNSLGATTPCPDWNTTQKEISLTMIIEKPLQEPRISKCGIFGPRDLEQYRQEMLDGILDFKVGDGWDYTYHDRMVVWDDYKPIDQVQFVIDELKRNPYSRRAVIDVRNNMKDVYSNDPACLQHLQFTIRNNQLNMYTLFRSNDAVKAAYMNLFALSCLQEKIADAVGVKVGALTHRVNSYHCYERDFSLLNSFVQRINSGSDLVYRYDTDWSEQMADAREEIAETVKKLKNEQ